MRAPGAAAAGKQKAAGSGSRKQQGLSTDSGSRKRQGFSTGSGGRKWQGFSTGSGSKKRQELSPGMRKAWSLGFGIFLLVFWQILAMLIDRSFLLPSPLQVLQSLWDNREELFLEHLPATMQVVVLGGLIAVVLGFVLAMLMDLDHRIEKAVYPILTVTQTVPVMCLAPVFVLWFGYSVTMRVVVVVLVNFFSVTVNLFDGLKSTNTERTELMKTWGAGRLQQFVLLRLPTALPYLFTSLQVVVPWSFVGAAVSEWLGAPAGLGTFSRSCMMSVDAAGLLAPLVVLTGLALLVSGVLRLVEKKAVTWRGES